MTFPFYPSLLVDTIAVVPYSRNSRTHSVDQIKQIARSIQEFELHKSRPARRKPPNLSSPDTVASKAARLPEHPAKSQPSPSAAPLRPPKQALRIADNKLALSAAWDDALLRTELTDLRDLGFDLSLIGFDEMELSDMLKRSGLRTRQQRRTRAPR